MQGFDITQELQAFSDHVAPQLDVYEQAIFIYLLRHSYLDGKENIVIGLKSKRKKMGFGVGDNSKPMSEETITKKIQSLEAKGLIRKTGSGRSGTRLTVVKPTDTPLFRVASQPSLQINVEEIDFFDDPAGRDAILRREGSRCFYCFASLDRDNYVMEHVVSRPTGDGRYTNIVAACRTCNNKKSNVPAEDFVRILYRERMLSESEFHERLTALSDLQAGRLVPELDSSSS